MESRINDLKPSVKTVDEELLKNLNTEIKLTSAEWYHKRKEHWEKKDPNVFNMVGGFEDSNLPDIKCSIELLSGLIRTNQLNPKRALDCGAGIGRITENILAKFFEEIDLLEQNEKFVAYCKEIFKNNKKIRQIYNSSLQEFKFEKKYDLIWVQWCLENLEDEDLDPFLKKCLNALNENGIVIIKENLFEFPTDIKENIENEPLASNKNYLYSDEDFSKQRPDNTYINLFIKNGFKIKLHFLNPNWPSTMEPLCVYVLEKA